MRRNLLIIMLCVLFVAGWTFKPGAQQWEYKTAYAPTDKELNALGSDGWELAAIVPGGGGAGGGAAAYLFKRRL